jgi:hypothetical protein
VNELNRLDESLLRDLLILLTLMSDATIASSPSRSLAAMTSRRFSP